MNHLKDSDSMPDNRDVRETGQNAPGKQVQAQQKIEIEQSGFGREQSQTPADEHLEHFSQIVVDAQYVTPHRELEDDHAGYLNDETSADRDTGNNDEGEWESSRTARHK